MYGKQVNLQNSCTVCLKLHENLKPITLKEDLHVTIKEKLGKCVPEVDWENGSKICLVCLQQLKTFCEFHDQCIQSFFSCKSQEKEHNYSKCAFHDQCIQSFFNCKIQENEHNYSKPPHCEAERKESSICFDCEHEHTNNEKVKCDFCKGLLPCEKSLMRHKLTCFKKPNYVKTPHVCKIWRKTFTTKTRLKVHMTTAHTFKFKCELCGKKFITLHALKHHKRNCQSSSERKHICILCGKRYKTAGYLYTHKKYHENMRAYRCHICGKTYNASGDLGKHMICVHQDSSLWKFNCYFCKKFALKHHLDQHMPSHQSKR